MRDVHKLCKICLNAGTRDIFDSGFTNIVSRDELSRIAEKLRFVTLLKVSPKENLPQQICDLCIVQLNVSYNFKRLALKNDFYIRQYMIENGMNLLKDDDDTNMETSLEIHQIHNVIRTSNRYRPPPAISSVTHEPFRRNSTTSSVSGISTMIVNSCETNGTATSVNASNSLFAHPSRPFVQPIQIKTEPIDPDEVIVDKSGPTNQSSPSSSSSGSVLTVKSSEKSLRRAKTPPMIVINGHIGNSPKSHRTTVKSSKPSSTVESKANESIKASEKKNKENEEPKKTKILPTRSVNDSNTGKRTAVKPPEILRSLRTIKKPAKLLEGKRKLREAAKKIMEKRNQQKEEKAKAKMLRKKQKSKSKVDGKSKIAVTRGRPHGTVKKRIGKKRF